MNTNEMLVTILQKITSIEVQMCSVGQKMSSMERNINSMEQKMDAMDTRIKPLETLPQQIREIQMTLENEIRRDIRMIAEGQLDLSRKLDQAMEFQKEKEIFLLRITALEGDVQRIKSRIGMK